MDRDPIVSLDSNILNVDGKPLRADIMTSHEKATISVRPDELTSILVDSRRMILSGIESMYEQTKQNNPGATVVRPSIWTARLGKTHQMEGSGNKVFTEAGRRNGGVITWADEIHEDFHEHWIAATEAGFLPEVRRASGKSVNGGMGGAWLLIKKPQLIEVAEQWFNYDKGPRYDSITTQFKGIDHTEPEEFEISSEIIRRYRVIGQKTVDIASGKKGNFLRPQRQIGLELAVAALKFQIGDMEGYESEINNAFTYADESPYIRQDAIRALENSTFGT